MNRIIKRLFKYKSFSFKSEGSSMLPLLQTGNIIYFKKIAFNNLSINDIVLFKKRGRVLTHRVTYKAHNHLITKGDNNLNADGKIFPRQIIGKVYQVKRTSDVLKRNGQVFSPESLYLLQLTLIIFSTRLIDFFKVFDYRPEALGRSLNKFD